MYENNHYHEECLRCNSCGLNLTGPNQKRARRFKNQILCDLHFADVALMECSDFMQQLRSFKPQSLGCAVARRKSSTTLIFPLPPQACSGMYALCFFLQLFHLEQAADRTFHNSRICSCACKLFRWLHNCHATPRSETYWSTIN
uniref:LIM zinc-binding domain-containing protein n=1 Tax=Anopheles culicifacies TaxID=139723 RepID=A0A182LXD3_9DIPT